MTDDTRDLLRAVILRVLHSAIALGAFALLCLIVGAHPPTWAYVLAYVLGDSAKVGAA